VSPNSIERLAPQEKLAWKRWIFGFREMMRDHIRTAFPPETSGLLEAITLGIREGLDWDLRESFRLAGVSHLLAISGLHVGFISAFFFFILIALFRRLPPNSFPVSPVVMTPMKLASLVVIPIVILFTVLTGARVSTVRASIMAVVYLSSRLLERPGGALHSIFLAALIILVLQPGFIWDTGFQLSFIAVVAIILAARRLPRPEPSHTLKDWGWWRNRLIQFAGIQGMVSITLAPLTASHFQEIHLAGLLTNFFLIPIASITVPLTFLVSCFSALSNFILSFSLDWIWLPADMLLGVLAQQMINIAHIAASIPAGTINVPPPSPFLIGLFLISLCLALGMRSAAMRKTGWISVAFTMAFIFTPLLPNPPLPSGNTSLMIPDAGRDDVFFIRLPDGRGYVIDSGRKSRSKFDTWRNVLAPLLRTLNERNWDSLFLLGNKGTNSTAEQVLNIGMNLNRVIKIEWDGTVQSRTIFGGNAERFLSSGFNPSQILWRTSSEEARLSIRKLGYGHLAFELLHGKAHWLFLIKRGRKPIQKIHLPSGKFDLVRLPEPMLREESVLQWLEKIRPAAIIAAPMRTKRLPIEQWRRIRTRQRSLGVYRPGRDGMFRASTDGKSLNDGARAERYSPSTPWPGTSHPRWAKYWLSSEKIRFGSTREPKPKFQDHPAGSR
jgi:ComEC/Rec2-related protein